MLGLYACTYVCIYYSHIVYNTLNVLSAILYMSILNSSHASSYYSHRRNQNTYQRTSIGDIKTKQLVTIFRTHLN